MSIRSDLELDITQGLDAIAQLSQALSTQLGAAASDFSASLASSIEQLSSLTGATINITADTAPVAAALADVQALSTEPAVVQIEGDAAPLLNTAADAEQTIDAQTANVQLQLDLGDLAAQATTASTSIEQELPSIDVPLNLSDATAISDLQAFQGEASALSIDVPVIPDTSQALDIIEAFVSNVRDQPVVEPIEGDFADLLASLGAAREDAAQSPITVPIEPDIPDFLSTLGASIEDVNLATTINVEPDLSPYLAAIAEVEAQPIAAPVTADTTNFLTEVDDAEQSVIANPVDIPINADTSNFAANAGSTGAGNEQILATVGGVGLLQKATQGLQSAFAAAQGDATGLATSVGGLNTGLAAGTAAATAAAVAIGELGNEGLKGVAAIQRLNLVFGDQAHAVQQINVGGLSGDITKLGLAVGTTAPSIQQAVSNLGFLAENSGFTSDRTKELIGNFSALALQAVAMKPALGNVGDVINLLVPALSRGGRFALQFGLSLDSAQINALALQETGKSTASELTALEKAFAGAEIAAGQLGDRIGTNFAQGSQQAAVQFKALRAEISQTFIDVGEPLVQPILDLFKGAVPIFADFAKSVGSVAEALVSAFQPLAQAALPVLGALAAGFGALAPIITTIADVIKAIPTPVLEAVAAFLAFKEIIPILAAVGVELEDLFITKIAANVALMVTSLEEAEGAIATFGVVLDALGGPIGIAALAIGAFVGLAAAIFGFGESAKAAAPVTSTLADNLTKVNDKADAAAGSVKNLSANISDQLASGSSDLGKFGAILTQNNNDLQVALDKTGFSVTQLASDLSIGEKGSLDFVQHTVAAVKGGSDAIQTIANASGQSVAQLEASLASGSTTLLGVIGKLEGTANAQGQAILLPPGTEDVASKIDIITKAYDDYNTKVQASAKTSLLHALNTGQLTLAEQGQLNALLALNPAQANFISLLNQVVQGTNNATPGIEKSRQAYVVLGQTIATTLASGGQITNDFAEQVAARFGVTASEIEQFAGDVQTALDKVSQAFVSALPSVTSFFADFRNTQTTAFNNLVSAGSAFRDAQTQFTTATTSGLQSQRDAIKSAADSLDKANTTLEDVLKKRSSDINTGTSETSIQRSIVSDGKAIDTARAGVVTATDSYNKAQDALAKAQNSAADSFAKAQKKLQDANSSFAAAFDPSNLTKKLQDEFKTLEDFDKNINILLKSNNTDLVQALLQQGPLVGGALADQFVKAGPKVTDAANTAAGNVRKELQSLSDEFSSPAFVQKLPGGAQAIADAAAKDFGVTLSTAGPTQAQIGLNAILKVFGPDSPEFKQALADANLGGAQQKILDALFTPNKPVQLRQAELAGGVNSGINSAINSLSLTQGSGGNALTNFSNELTTSIAGAIKTGADAATPAAGQIGKDIVTGLSTSIAASDKDNNGPAKATTDMANRAIEAAQKALGTHSPSTAFIGIGQDVVSGFAQGINGVDAVLGAAIDEAFKRTTFGASLEAAAAGIGIGQALATGIVAGVSQLNPTLAKAMNDMVAALEKAARAAANSHSPSLLFADIGKDLALGLAQGIDQNHAPIEEAARNAVKSASDAASKVAAGSVTVGTSVSTTQLAAVPVSVPRTLTPIASGGIDSDTASTLKALADTLDKSIKATRPIEQTFNEKVDPLHVAADIQWKLTR